MDLDEMMGYLITSGEVDDTFALKQDDEEEESSEE